MVTGLQAMIHGKNLRYYLQQDRFGTFLCILENPVVRIYLSCKSTLLLTSIPKSSKEVESLLSFKNQILQLNF